MGGLLETTGVQPLAMLAAVPLGKRRLGAAGAVRGPSPSHDARCVWLRVNRGGNLISSHCYSLLS